MITISRDSFFKKDNDSELTDDDFENELNQEYLKFVNKRYIAKRKNGWLS